MKPKGIVQDDSGRIRDEEGNIIHLKSGNAVSSKININKRKEKEVKDLLKMQRGVIERVSYLILILYPNHSFLETVGRTMLLVS